QCQNERSQTSNRATAMAMLRSKLVEKQERERQEEIAREKGEAQDVNFGSQIRSYVPTCCRRRPHLGNERRRAGEAGPASAGRGCWLGRCQHRGDDPSGRSR